MINELKAIESTSLLFYNKLILYGAGLYGLETYHKLRCAGISVAYFCDSDPQKWGEAVVGIEILSPKRLKELDEKEDLVIVVSTGIASALEIIKSLEDLELKTNNVLTLNGLAILLAQNASNVNISGEFRDYLFATESLEKELPIIQHKAILMSRLNYANIMNTIIVYQPGKVGSSTICDSLSAVSIKNATFHYLVDYPPVFELGLTDYLKTALCTIRKREHIKIITLIREPIIREYSLLFQYLGMFGPYMYMSVGDSFIDTCAKVLETHTFSLRDKGSSYGSQFDWFDCELKTAFGIDVFGHPFDREKGYTIIKQGNIELLLMKLEKLDSLEPIIGDFVGAPNFKLINSNEGSNKIYKYLYKNVRESIKISREVVDVYYKDNPRMDHFYSEEEKAKFMEKWEDNIAPVSESFSIENEKTRHIS